MKQRPYQGASDLALLQRFNAEARAATAGCGYLHVGDIPHHIYNGNRLYDPAEFMTIWEDQQGVAAWVLVGPRHKEPDVQVRPDLRGGSFHREVLAYAAERTVTLMRRHQIEGDHILFQAFHCDTDTIEILTEQGWQPDGEPAWTLNRIKLVDLPEPVLPAGYRVRAATGVEDAALLAEIHFASFGSSWTPELYAKLMETPGYAAEREFIVETDEGKPAAFTLTRHDTQNRVGLFEPVGTHRDHRRRGLGKGLLLTVMRHMADQGLAWGEVVNSGSNEASRALYRSAGFEPRYQLDGFVKPIPAEPAAD